jgi:tRNA G46 methylase TrmB
MSVWKEYLRRRELREGLADGGDPVAKFKFNTDDEDYAEDYEKVQQELFKTVMSKYPNETLDFLNTIAQRGDEEIASLLRKMKKDKGPKLPHEPQHPTEGDEVVPSTADTGHNPDFNSGE